MLVYFHYFSPLSFSIINFILKMHSCELSQEKNNYWLFFQSLSISYRIPSHFWTNFYQLLWINQGVLRLAWSVWRPQHGKGIQMRWGYFILVFKCNDDFLDILQELQTFLNIRQELSTFQYMLQELSKFYTCFKNCLDIYWYFIAKGYTKNHDKRQVMHVILKATLSY